MRKWVVFREGKWRMEAVKANSSRPMVATAVDLATDNN